MSKFLVALGIFIISFVLVSAYSFYDIKENWYCTDGYNFERYFDMPCGNYTYITCGVFNESQGVAHIKMQEEEHGKWIKPIEWCPVLKEMFQGHPITNAE